MTSEVKSKPEFNHYPLSAQKVSIVPGWKQEVIQTIEKMITEINDPYDGSVQITLSLSRKIVSIKPYVTDITWNTVKTDKPLGNDESTKT